MSSEPRLPPNVLDLTGKVNCNSDIYNAYASGGMADLFKGNYNGNTVAVKIIRPFDRKKLEVYRRRFLREAKTWMVLSSGQGHTNVLKLIGVMNWKTNRPALISPFQRNGIVLDYIGNNPQADRRLLALGVASGLQYIHNHEKGVAHGDLKSNNVLVDDRGTPLISDFGQSRLFDDEDYSTFTVQKQQKAYIAPEIIVTVTSCPGIDTFSVITQEADIYAFSITAFEVLSGEKYEFKYTHNLMALVVERGVRPPEGVIHKDYFTLLVRCWEADPRKRLKINDVVQELGMLAGI